MKLLLRSGMSFKFSGSRLAAVLTAAVTFPVTVAVVPVAPAGCRGTRIFLLDEWAVKRGFTVTPGPGGYHDHVSASQ